MFCIMLMGAWFLIHQHCCLADAGVSSRNIMVDPLMRRSPLEKNFIRFGRSHSAIADEWGATLNQGRDHGVSLERAGQDRSQQRDTRGKENFIRFGRSHEPLGREADPGPASSSPAMKNRFFDADWPTRFISRITRSKQNFIRFGRSNDLLNKNKKYSGLNKDNFIRFGRRDDDVGDNLKASDIDDHQPDEKALDKKNNISSGFIRFSKSADRLSSYMRGVREKRDVNPSSNDGNHNLCANRTPPNFDPMMMVAPDFLLFPKIPFQQTPLKDNFVRLG